MDPSRVQAEREVGVPDPVDRGADPPAGIRKPPLRALPLRDRLRLDESTDSGAEAHREDLDWTVQLVLDRLLDTLRVAPLRLAQDRTLQDGVSRKVLQFDGVLEPA